MMTVSMKVFLAALVATLCAVSSVMASADGGCIDHDRNPLTACISPPNDAPLELDLQYEVEGDTCVGRLVASRELEEAPAIYSLASIYGGAHGVKTVPFGGGWQLQGIRGMQNQSMHVFGEGEHIDQWHVWNNFVDDATRERQIVIRYGALVKIPLTITDSSMSPHTLMATCNERLKQARLLSEEQRANLAERAGVLNAQQTARAAMEGIDKRLVETERHHADMMTQLDALFALELAAYEAHKILVQTQQENQRIRAARMSEHYASLADQYAQLQVSTDERDRQIQDAIAAANRSLADIESSIRETERIVGDAKARLLDLQAQREEAVGTAN